MIKRNSIYSIFAVFFIPAELSDTNFQLAIVMVLVATPTIFHVLLIGRDLLHKLLVRPFFVFISGLLEYLSEEKQPLTWVLGILGTLPAIMKSWMQVGH